MLPKNAQKTAEKKKKKKQPVVHARLARLQFVGLFTSDVTFDVVVYRAELFQREPSSCTTSLSLKCSITSRC